MSFTEFDILIIGGGPAGSIAAVDLAANGMTVAMVERRRFPREVLCGEFLSHEVLGMIRNHGMHDDFLALHPRKVTTFRFVSANGEQVSHALGFDAYAVKRSRLDQLLLSKAASGGAVVFQPADVVALQRNGRSYCVTCKTEQGERMFVARHVIAAYGRQNILDKSLRRAFASVRSRMAGVKYHIPKTMLRAFVENEIRIYAADGIYCGINSVSADEATLCFLSDANVHHADPRRALNLLLEKNALFRDVFASDLWPALQNLPVVGTGNIFFGRRNVVEDGVFMIGDAAGVIAPVAGDGIGMAMESGALVARVLNESWRQEWTRETVEDLYASEWRNLFARRLKVAKYLQKAALNSRAGNLGGSLMQTFPHLTEYFIRWTRK